MAEPGRIARLFPVWALAVGASHKAARLAWQNRALRRDLAVANADREALRAHFELAVSQRDRARDLAAAVVAEPAWVDEAESWANEGGA